MKTQTTTEPREKVREPLFHIVKRPAIPLWKSILIRFIAIVAAMLLSAVIAYCLKGISPLEFYKQMFSGAFGTSRRIWIFIYNSSILLCVALALTPAFKMRFWNIGGEGQVLVGGLATAAVMFYLGGKVSNPVLYLLMTVAAIVAGIIWGVIPAIFQSRWKTNETLFTLMMNYIAIQLVSFFINRWDKSGHGYVNPMTDYGFPQLVNKWLLSILVVAALTVFMYIYLKYSKHGYELSVVGESENTARYIGINVKKVVIRTMILSGAICGIAGLLIVGGYNNTVAESTAGGRGFTAIMVSWLGKFNPIFMVLTSLLICFMEVGSKQVCTTFKINESITDIVTAVILFFIIGCEFFINYKIMFRHAENADPVKNAIPAKPAENAIAAENANAADTNPANAEKEGE